MNKRIMKRLFGLLLSVILVLTLIPATVFAADTTQAWTKAGSPQSGKQYVVVAVDGNNGKAYALSGTADAGYKNQSNYSYSGLAGTAVSLSGKTITSTVTDDMIWTVNTSGSNITLQNGGQYLGASYAGNSNGGSDGKIFKTSTAQNWTYDGTSIKDTSTGKYLVFDSAADHQSEDTITSGSADLFTIRSSTRNDVLYFYELKTVQQKETYTGTFGKVTSATVGKNYVIVAKDSASGATYALGVEAMAGYANTNSYSYTGLEGIPVTVSGNKVTSTVTSDMVWQATSSGLQLQNVYTGDYLYANYRSNAGGDLSLSATGSNWYYDGSSLQERNSSKYLQYDSSADHQSEDTISSGNANLFTIRSSSKDEVALYEMGSDGTIVPVVPDTPNDPVNGTVVAFTSDVHNQTDNKSADRLNTWINNMYNKHGKNIDTMGFTGDNANASAGEAQYWQLVQNVQDVVKNNSHVNDMFMVPGNHEWDPGNMGTNNSAARNALKTVGMKKEASAYVLYSFGATSNSDSGSGYKTEDLTALENYLKTAPQDRPIFILSHFPIHSYGNGGGWNSRSTKNADQMISILNKYGTDHQIIFLWGHNHTLSDSNYDNIHTDSINGTAINFTYAAAGCMSDSEYSSGSNSVKGKGLVAVINGTNVSLTYYNVNGGVVAQGTAKVPSGAPSHTHAYTSAVTKAATCTEAGVRTYTCTCGDSYTEAIAATGHTAVSVAAVAPTCTTAGTTAGTKCSVCGTVISGIETVAATGHTWGAWTVVKPATETEKGLSERVCSTCGAKETKEIEYTVHDHNYANPVVTKEATCTTPGEEVYTCTICGANMTVVIPAKEHTAVAVTAKPSTCTVAGHKAGTVCSVCGTVIDGMDALPMTAHTWSIWKITTAPTVEKEGEKVRECTVCGATESVVMPKIEANGIKVDETGALVLIKDGKKDVDYTGFYAEGDKAYYVERGVITGTKTDVIKDTTNALGTAGAWYYVVNSEVSREDTVAKNDKGWWKITDGAVDFSYTGFAINSKGKWYVENGQVKFNKNDVIKDTTGALGTTGAWYYVVKSQVTYTNTVAKNASGWWCIHNGVVDFTCNSVEKNDKGWWKIVNGKVDFNYTGVAKNDKGWWRIESGKVNFNFNGIASNANGSWYLKDGKVQFGYNGKVVYAGKTYNVVNGKATVVSTAATTTVATGTVYWVSGGSVYHKTNKCPSLSRSTNIKSGTIAQSGKARACKDCF